MKQTRKYLFGTTFLVSALALSGAAFAQTPPAGSSEGQEASQVDEIVVTGSRLRRENFDTPVPVTQVGSEEFERTGAGNAIDVLEELTLVGAGSNSRGANTQFGDNFAFVDLFNLGTQRTLTLVNGRRFISGNQATTFVPDNATGAQVDISVIPPLLIDRVEVTPGTGGAVYGADAVAGVVNFVLKQDFEGLEALGQVGITEHGDGERYRVSALWGKTFYDDRANVTLSGDYYKQELVTSGADRPWTNGLGSFINLDNGTRRNTAFSAGALADEYRSGSGVTVTPFLGAGFDRVRPNIYAGNVRNGIFTGGGLITTGATYPTGFSGSTALIPHGPVSAALANRAADPQGFAFFAPSALPTGVSATAVINTLAPGTNTSGLTPAQVDALALSILQANRPTPSEYYAANPGLNPLLFVGSFNAATGTVGGAPAGMFPTIINPDAATRGLFPRLAVPLQFDSSGALIPYSVGDAGRGILGTNIGGDGFSNAERGYTNLQSATERASFAALTSFEVTPSITYRGEYMYTDIQYRSVGGVDSNSLGGSTTAGNRAIPIYIDQNPYFSAANRAQIDALVAQGLTVPTLNGERVLFVNRALADIYGGPVRSGNNVETWRTAQSLEGTFGLFDRRFYWDASYVYGQNDIENIGQNILDHEFALATDVVIGPNGQPVCRQQTLANPESIAIRNPTLSAINTTLGLTPSRAAVEGCQPLNLFGENNSDITDAARQYVIADTGSFNEARQHYLQASFSGEIFKLPAGWISAGAQIEWRNESLKFMPAADFATGAARNTTGTFSQGELRFLEYGYELAIPIFGPDFNFPLFHALDINGAYRIVDRDQQTTTPGVLPAPGTTDDVYTASIRWALTEDIAFRANKSTSVRSASIIELFGAPGAGFVNGTNGLIPCTPTAIGQGPNPTVRRANCIRAAILTGAAANEADAIAFLANYTGTVASRPAATNGNSFLNNEQSEAIGFGVTLTPRWIPRLTIAADYYEQEILGQVGLVGVPTTINQCFDTAEFPESSLAGTPACDLFYIGVRDGSGNYVNPTINPLTGRPTIPISNPGAPAVVNQPFESAFFIYPNFNLAAVKMRALNIEGRYNFGLDELFGERASRWGDIFLSASVYNLIQYDVSANGTFTDTNKNAGEPGFAEWEFRFDLGHRAGRLDHRLTWMRTSGTITNVQTAPSSYPELDDTARFPAFSMFNYSLGYQLRDNVNLRVAVNNLFDDRGPFEDLGVVTDTIGRSFLFTASTRF